MPTSQTVHSIRVESITMVPITPENFSPYGQLITPQSDGKVFDAMDAQLCLDAGTPRFYLMTLQNRGRQFHTMTYHQHCTQCLGALEGRDWFMAVAPAGDPTKPDPAQLKAFHIPGNCFIKLESGTWHAGPYFEHDIVNFYNLELSDTNVVDHHSYNFLAQDQLLYELRKNDV